jgi:hypothetical protein
MTSISYYLSTKLLGMLGSELANRPMQKLAVNLELLTYFLSTSKQRTETLASALR